MWTSSQVFSC
ncbi:Protein of unknown function [Pyronema omphalodes CBS 100304]|uniref:Uncharacterized protein n=1 Tax=Pyronema omphalodes (strain CBS 100304) TaxID=1076935 RepID=U4LDS2_PYROM|nr:Protein of unknown function [Pyronema omphalodes CBS 100304]